MTPRTLLAGAALSVLAITAHATDLLQVWQAALLHDPQGSVINANRAVGAQQREQASALWRPQLGFSASAGIASANSQIEGAEFAAPPSFPATSGASFGTSVNGGNMTRWALNATQPLYNLERQAQSKQLVIAADSADIEWQAAQQDWMLQTTQRYFNALLAERRLALLLQQQSAVEKALTEARDRFALGDSPVTDTHEALARARSLQAQAVAAASDVELARHALADFTGLPRVDLQLQAPSGRRQGNATLEPLAHWLALAQQNNLMLKRQQAQASAAREEVRKHSALGAPTLDLVAQATQDRLSGSGDFGTASNSQRQQMVGLTLNVPLYTGGWRNAKEQEALRLEDKARAEVERARLQVAQLTRAAWLGLQTGQVQQEALETALTAQQARLDATRLGRQLGDRTTLDLLNAENDASAATLALLQARIDTLQNRLRLDALVGQLDIVRLQAVNHVLQP
jgi:outer membrane protein